MSKLSVPEFLEDTLGLAMHVLSDKGWYRCQKCPYHEETKGSPSFGVQVVYPYLIKCFSCGTKGTIVDLTAHLLKMSKERAQEFVNAKVDVKLELRDQVKRRVSFVPDAVAEAYEYCFDGSLGARYVKSRGVPKWAAKLWQLGYSDLERALVVPMRNAANGKIQAYTSIVFQGDELFKSKPPDCGAAVTVPSNYKAFENALVVEGYIDGIKAAMAMWSKGMRIVPIAVNTAMPSKEQLKLIRGYKRVYIGMDHDPAGEKGAEYLRRQLRDKAFVYEFIYPELLKDPGELTEEHEIAVKLIL